MKKIRLTHWLNNENPINKNESKYPMHMNPVWYPLYQVIRIQEQDVGALPMTFFLEAKVEDQMEVEEEAVFVNMYDFPK